ncbi:MAG: M20/M25/M40 family metallo-hydrolase [Planctomycetota bacterium]
MPNRRSPLVLVLCAGILFAEDPDPMSAEALIETVKALSSVAPPGTVDSNGAYGWTVKGGRGPRSGGYDAARWIAARFGKAGLQPAPGRESFLVPFDVEVRWLQPDGGLSYVPAYGDPEPAQLRKDWLPLCFSAPGDVRARVVFVGYGITAPEWKYDDYAEVDVRGKVVLALAHEPREDQDGDAFEGKKLSRHGTEAEKAANAQRHGATALVIVADTKHADDEPLESDATAWPGVVPPKDRERIDSDMGRAMHLDEWTWAAGRQARHARLRAELKIPCAMARRSWIERVLPRGALDLAEAQAGIDSDLAPRSRELRERLGVAVDFRVERLPSANVVARVPGQVDEAIVVGAHYDHFDPIGRTVFPGACDNASGTAVLLGVAEALAASKPRRTVYFVAFGGEELGLQGSRAFAADPPVPLGELAAMVNLDMAGRGEEGELTLLGVVRNPELAQVARDANAEVGFTLAENIEFAWPHGSDHFAFHEAGVPSLMLTSSRFGEYHTAKDTADQVSGPKMAKVASLLSAFIERLAAGEGRFPAPKEVDVPFPSRK